MYDKTPYFYGTGRRKSSVARVYLTQGTGKITINKRDIDDFFGMETLKTIVRQPLVTIDGAEKYDCMVTVKGTCPQVNLPTHSPSGGCVSAQLQ